MYDDRPLVDLITSRCDDIVALIADLKRDMVRISERHEADDKERFQEHHARLSELEKAHWKQIGVMSVVNILVVAVWTYLFGH